MPSLVVLAVICLRQHLAAKNAQCQRIRFRGLNGDGPLVDHPDAGDGISLARLVRINAFDADVGEITAARVSRIIEQRQAESHIVRGQRRPIREFQIVAQMEGVRELITGDIPFLGQVGNILSRIIGHHQTRENRLLRVAIPTIVIEPRQKHTARRIDRGDECVLTAVGLGGAFTWIALDHDLVQAAVDGGFRGFRITAAARAATTSHQQQCCRRRDHSYKMLTHNPSLRCIGDSCHRKNVSVLSIPRTANPLP